MPNCFIIEAVKYGQITIKASAPVYRNFVSIHKVNSTILHMLEYETNEIVSNLCSDDTLELSEIAEIVKKSVSELINKEIIIKCPNRESNFTPCPTFVVNSNINDNLNKTNNGELEALVNLLSKYYCQTFQGA